MGIVVSAAGPLSNLLLAFVTTLLYVGLKATGLWSTIGEANPNAFEAIRIFVNYMVTLNILLFLFNLIPLPPLDGYRILEDVALGRCVIGCSSSSNTLFYFSANSGAAACTRLYD